MKKHFLVAGAAVLALGFAVSTASAHTCPTYQHPSKTKGLTSSLTQAFVSCNNPGGNTPNTTAGGVPACAPIETFNEATGSPAGGWLWGLKSSGTVTVRPQANKLGGPLNTPGVTADLGVTLKVSGIEDENGVADGTNGTLSTVARATLNDSVNGMVSVIDFPAGFPVAVVNGKIGLKTSANVLLNGLGLPGLGSCSSIEVVSIQLLDPNGNPFGVMGSYLQHP
jgi:hypothetical protein